MQLYTFYPCKPDGTSETFITLDLPDDETAQVHAAYILDRHEKCSHVVAWAGERQVLTRHRGHSTSA